MKGGVNVKEKAIIIKVSIEEKSMIKRAASFEGLAVATYLRKLALDDAKAKGFTFK
jgi:uncharacterized protein (DUF1778 family)